MLTFARCAVCWWASGIPELVNLQEVGGQAKPYQIRQVLRLVERYNLLLEVER